MKFLSMMFKYAVSGLIKSSTVHSCQIRNKQESNDAPNAPFMGARTDDDDSHNFDWGFRFCWAS